LRLECELGLVGGVGFPLDTRDRGRGALKSLCHSMAMVIGNPASSQPF
jgi:hypothetical protein